VKRLHWLVLKSFLGPFVMTFFIVLFILLMQFLWRYIDELVGKGLDFNIILELMMYAASSLVPLALPLAILLSSLMTFGNMGEFYELTAIKASGISLRRIMMPIILVTVFISIGAFFFSNNVLPVTNLKMKSLLFDVRQQRPEVSITDGVFYNGLDNYSIRVSKKDPVTNILNDIRIYDHSRNRGNIDVTIADSGRMKMTSDKQNMIITLWHGYRYTEVESGHRTRREKGYYPHEQFVFEEENVLIKMKGFDFVKSDESIWKNAYQMLDVEQLGKAIDSLHKELKSNYSILNRTMYRDNLFKLTKEDVIRSHSPYPMSGNPAYAFSPENTGNDLNAPARPGNDQNVAHPPVSANNEPSRMEQSMPGSRIDLAAKRREALLRRQRMEQGILSRKDEARKMALQPREDLAQNKPASIDSSLNMADVPKIVLKKITNFDTLLNSYNFQNQVRIYNVASGFVTQSQMTIEGAGSGLDYEVRLLRRHEIEWHRKFTLSVACLVFLFIGAPLGAIIRKGGLGLPTVISTLLFILYYIISLTGEKFVRESILTSLEGMWLSSFILIIAGIFLTYQATNDSAILNVDTYINWFREKMGLKKGILLEKKESVAGKFELIEIPKEELQEEFRAMSKLAASCLESLKTETKLYNLHKKIMNNHELLSIHEFEKEYNKLIDRIIMSEWFRIPYFRKRLSEYPYISGNITSVIFTKKFYLWISVIVFPVGLARVFHFKMKVQRTRMKLKQVVDLSAGMINLLNSSALKAELAN
jgi:lipopolysaccharide export system permease protein